MRTDEEDTIDALVGRRVRDHRVRLGLSQTQLAQAIGVSFQQVQKYERGANRISASKLWLIGRCLGVGPNALLADLPGNEAAATREDRGEGASETAELIAAFGRIADPRRRRTVIEVAKGLGGDRPGRRVAGP